MTLDEYLKQVQERAAFALSDADVQKRRAVSSMLVTEVPELLAIIEALRAELENAEDVIHVKLQARFGPHRTLESAAATEWDDQVSRFRGNAAIEAKFDAGEFK